MAEQPYCGQGGDAYVQRVLAQEREDEQGPIYSQQVGDLVISVEPSGNITLDHQRLYGRIGITTITDLAALRAALDAAEVYAHLAPELAAGLEAQRPGYTGHER